MNRGLILKSFRELAVITAVVGALVMVVEGLLTFVLAKFQTQLSVQLTQLPFVQSFVAAMVGAENGTAPLGPEIFGGVPWVHPVILAFVLGHAIVCCTRVPAGEVDRGTIDVLLGMPVSRWRLYVSDTAVWILAATFVSSMVLVGNVVMNLCLDPTHRQDPVRSAMVAVSLLALALSVGGMASLCSALSSRKGRAMAAAVALVLAWFLMNYLAQLWKPAHDVAFLSVLHYYKPVEILRTGEWPWKNLGVLLGSATVFWAIGGAIFARRDLSTL